ncbi:MAG: TraR/DksA family transcriptional regulator [Thermodesulfobacteriota bacterium]
MSGGNKKGKTPSKGKTPVKKKPAVKKMPVKIAPVKKPAVTKSTIKKAAAEKTQLKKSQAKKPQVVPPRKAGPPAKKPASPPKRSDFRASFLETLQQKQAEIKETLDRLMKSRKEYNGEHTAGDFIDEVDDAQREISAYSQYSLIERKIRELRRVQLLITRISKEEEFGLCEECGNPIPKERLMVMPDATLCVPCQRELEKLDLKRSMAARGSANFGTRKDMDWEGSGAGEEEDSMLIEYHIGSLPAVDIDEAEVESPSEEKEEK